MSLNTSGVDSAFSGLITALTRKIGDLDPGAVEGDGLFNISILGNAATATRLQNPITINGTTFDGTQDLSFTSLHDNAGNLTLVSQGVLNAVNYVTVQNAATTGAVQLRASGTDANVGMTVAAKGLGILSLEAGTDIEIKPQNGNLRLFSQNNLKSWDVNLGTPTNNGTLYLPEVGGNVHLVPGTMVTLEDDNSFTGTNTFTQPLKVENTFNIDSLTPGSQQNGLYIAGLGNSVGLSNNPANTVLIAAQVASDKSIALTVDTEGYVYGYNSAPLAGQTFFSSKTRFADSLTESRLISLTGDATGEVDFNGSQNAAIPVILADSGVTPGSYNTITVDSKGRVIGGSNVNYATGNQTVNFTGDVSGSGTTDVTLTLSTTGVSPGTYNTVNVDSKGRVTFGASYAFLTSNQNITVSGDVTGSGSTSLNLSLSTTGVSAGTYTKVTTDAKGRIQSGTNLSASDIPNLSWSKITSGTPTTLAGYGITDGLSAVATNSMLILENSELTTSSIFTTDVTPSQVLDSFSLTQFRSAEYMIQAEYDSAFQLSKLLVMHDGTSAYMSEFGEIMTAQTLIDVDVAIVDGQLQLQATPYFPNISIKAIRTAITV